MKSPENLETILKELECVMLKKHEDYGPMNISGAPGGPMNGLRVRMYDKLARLNNLTETGDTPNYAISSIFSLTSKPTRCLNLSKSLRLIVGS